MICKRLPLYRGNSPFARPALSKAMVNPFVSKLVDGKDKLVVDAIGTIPCLDEITRFIGLYSRSH